MKILVTGGAGFIGSHVVDEFIEAGHEVAVVDNLSTGKRKNVNPEATFYQVDIRDDELAEVFEHERPQVVNHHAAQASVKVSVDDPLLDAGVNILGSLKLAQNCIRFGVKKLIFISSGGAIYGEVSGDPASETFPLSPLSPYAASKVAFEHYLPVYREIHGLNSTVLRYANVYGPRQDPLGEAGVVAIFSAAMLTGKEITINAMERVGDDGCLRDYVFVGDVAKSNVAVLKRGDGQAFNIGTGRGTTTKELCQAMVELSGFSGTVNHSPPRAGDLKRSVLSCQRSKELLGWRAEVSLREGLKKTMDYFGRTLRNR